MYRALLLLVSLSGSLVLADTLFIQTKIRDENVTLKVRALGDGRLEVQPSAFDKKRVWPVGVERIYVTHNRLFGTVRTDSRLTLREFRFTDAPSPARFLGGLAVAMTTATFSAVPIALPILALKHQDYAYALLNHLSATASPPGLVGLAASAATCAFMLLMPPLFRPAKMEVATEYEVVKVYENSAGQVDDIMFKIYDDAQPQSLNATLGSR